MFNWFTSKLGKARDEAHPLGSEAAVAAYLGGDLATRKPVHALAEIGDWLGDPERLAAELSPPAWRRAVRLLDEYAQGPLQEAWTGLFEEFGQDMTDAFWLPLSQYYGQAATAYHALLPHFPPEGNISAEERGELGLVALRAIMALAQRNKLAHMRYRAPGPGHWATVHELYVLAHARGVAVAVNAAYPNTRSTTTPHAQYLFALLFEAAPLDNIAPAQMEAIDRLLRNSSGGFVLRDAPDPRAPFAVAIPSADPPSRYHPDGATPPNCHYFGPGTAQQDLLQALSLLQRQTPPDWLTVPGLDNDAATHALWLLRDHWSKQPPQRKAPRAPEEGNLLVVHGFTQVRRMVAASAFIRSGKTFSLFSGYGERARIRDDYFGTVAETAVTPTAAEPEMTPQEMLQKLELAGDKDQMDRWRIVDTSATGLGAVVTAHRNWQAVGALVAYRRESAVYWEIAIIRRLSNQQGRRVAGLEVMQGIPQPVNVKATSAEAAANLKITPAALADFGDGVLLSAEQGRLLLPAGKHDVDALLLMLGDNVRLIVRLAEKLESTGEFDIFRYESA